MTDKIKKQKHLTINHEGEQYLAGSGGSLILSCQECGDEMFRYKYIYFTMGRNKEFCGQCGFPMEPVKIKDIESKWFPIWDKREERNSKLTIKPNT